MKKRAKSKETLLFVICEWCEVSLVVRLAHVVSAGTEPFKQEDGPGRGLNCHHHHQHPRGEILEIVIRSRKHETTLRQNLQRAQGRLLLI